MTILTPSLPKYLERHYNGKDPSKSEAFLVENYKSLVQIVAELSYLNKENLLFFRGQKLDFKNRQQNSTLYPSIYRGDPLPKNEIKSRFQILNKSSEKLCELFQERDINGQDELIRKKYVQWSILQHYEVCDTPLLDLTQSLRVAISFALHENDYKFGYIYLFGLPYLTNRISINSEHNLVNVRLLSICPPTALRPYYQEGYLVGTTDLTTNYPEKIELDFKRRLIAKFKIPTDASTFFQNSNISLIDLDELLPKDDDVFKICKEIEPSEYSSYNTTNELVGEFLKKWNELDEFLRQRTNKYDYQPRNTFKIINFLENKREINKGLLNEIDILRKFRNEVVHKTEKVSDEELNRYKNQLKQILEEISDQ